MISRNNKMDGKQTSLDPEGEHEWKISLLERLIRTHSIWFLPQVKSREECSHLLNGKEIGNFIVRHSVHIDTMVLTVKSSDQDAEPLDHILILQTNSESPKMRLECNKSENESFDNVLCLIYHYCLNRQQDLKTCLKLPQTLRDSTSRQNLSSVALLGKDFWRYPMSYPDKKVPKVPEIKINVEKRASFVDLLPMHQRSQFDIQTSIIKAQEQLLDEKYPLIQSPSSKSKERRFRKSSSPTFPSSRDAIVNLQKSRKLSLEGKTKKLHLPQRHEMCSKRYSSCSNALDDTLMDLEQVSNLLDASLTELKQDDNNNKSKAKTRKISHSLKLQDLDPDAKFKFVKKFKDEVKLSSRDMKQSPYFTSSVADKMSDYEDIWMDNLQGNAKHDLKTSGKENLQMIAQVENKSKDFSILEKDLEPFGVNKVHSDFKGLDESWSKMSVASSSTLSSCKPKDTSSSSTMSSARGFETSTTSSTCDTTPSRHDLSKHYSDPLDALEKAQDTRIYQCPEFSDLSEQENEDEVQLRTKSRPGVVATRQNANESAVKSEGEDASENISSCSLTRVKRANNSLKLQRPDPPSEDPSFKRNSVVRKGENRLSAVIGKYIRPPKGLTLNTSPRKSWQLDSSSWEFLGQEQNEEADISSFSDEDERSCTHQSGKKVIQVDQGTDSGLDQNTIRESREGSTGKKNLSTTSQSDSSSSNPKQPSSVISKDSLYDSGQHDTLNIKPESRGTLIPLDYSEDYIAFPKIFNQPESLTYSSSKQKIQECVMEMSAQLDSIFAQSIAKFVECTMDSKVKAPRIVMRNTRQFLNGMKNFLLRNLNSPTNEHLSQVIEAEREKLQSDECLDLDFLLEEILHHLVTKKLQSHFKQLYKQDFLRSGCLQLLSTNLKAAYLDKNFISELELEQENPTKLKQIGEKCEKLLGLLQESFSPIEKLKCFLAIVRIILEDVNSLDRSLDVEKFGSILSVVLVQNQASYIEMESEFIWSLLPQSLLSGECGYYLTLLSSTIHLLKTLKYSDLGEANVTEADDATKISQVKAMGSLQSNSSFSSNCTSLGKKSKSFVKVLIPQINNILLIKSFPVKKNMLIKDFTKMIAHQTGITNSEDYSLYCVLYPDNNEILLSENKFVEDEIFERMAKQNNKVESDDIQPLSKKQIQVVYKRNDCHHLISWS